LYLGPLPQNFFFEISPKIDFLSSYKNFARAKKVVAMRAEAPHKWSKVQPDQFNFRDFSSKKPEKRPEKNPKNRFSHKMAAKTTSGSGFRPYSYSSPSTWSF